MKIDYSVILNQCGGDKGLAKEIVVLFEKEAPRYLEEIKQALAGEDFKTIAGIAHTLKGSVSNFGVAEVSDAAIALETAAKAGNKEEVIVCLDKLSGYLHELIAALKNTDNFN